MKLLIILQALAQTTPEPAGNLTEWLLQQAPVIVVMGIVIYTQHNDRKAASKRWAQVVESKDAELKEVREGDKQMVKEMTHTLALVNKALEDHTLRDNQEKIKTKCDEIHNDIKSLAK